MSRPPKDDPKLQERLRQEAFAVLDTPLGKMLLDEGVVLKRWCNTVPANIWLEDADGETLVHSHGRFCPVSGLYIRLGRFLHSQPSANPPEEIYCVPKGLRAEYLAHKLAQSAPPAPSPPRPRRSL